MEEILFKANFHSLVENSRWNQTEKKLFHIFISYCLSPCPLSFFHLYFNKKYSRSCHIAAPVLPSSVITQNLVIHNSHEVPYYIIHVIYICTKAYHCRWATPLFQSVYFKLGEEQKLLLVAKYKEKIVHVQKVFRNTDTPDTKSVWSGACTT